MPSFVGMIVYAQTQTKKLIDKVHHLSLLVSKDHVSGLSGLMSGLDSAICDYFSSTGTVCTCNIKTGVFTKARKNEFNIVWTVGVVGSRGGCGGADRIG